MIRTINIIDFDKRQHTPLILVALDMEKAFVTVEVLTWQHC